MDAEAFVSLFRRQFGLVVSLMRARISDADEAEDLAMSVFELAWARHNHGGEITLPWLYQCVRNVVGNEYQRRDRRTRLQIKLAGEFDSVSQDPIESTDPALMAALKKLKAEDQELIFLVYWLDLSLAEAAHATSSSLASVKMRILRARKKLEVLLSYGVTGRGEHV